MKTIRIDDLKRILDPVSRYIFFDEGGVTEARLLRGVEKSFFIVQTGGSADCYAGRRSGYFVASNGRGIVRFSALTVALPGESSIPLERVEVQMGTLRLIDRRESIRYVFRIPHPILFRLEDRFIPVQLVNVSEGGMRLSSPERIPANLVYGFEINLPSRKGEVKLGLDGLVVYSEPEEKPGKHMTGVTFIAPVGANAKQREEFIVNKRKIAEFVAGNSELFSRG